MSDIRRRTIEGLRTGDTFTATRTFTEELVRAFGDLSRDYNPVHYDQRFASASDMARTGNRVHQRRRTGGNHAEKHSAPQTHPRGESAPEAG